MPDTLRHSLARLPLARLGEAAAIVAEALGRDQGVRIGQSTVLSTKVHAFLSHRPEHVQIMVDSDAGHCFYHRKDYGRIGHMDIFHECGEVNHRIAAQYICSALAHYRELAAQPALAGAGMVNPDFVDIQTATGGGRINGSLQYGKKLSVRRVHENHVHVALKLSMDNLFCLFYIVAAVEAAILDLGLEPRRNECIFHVESTDCLADLSPYSDQTDSKLIGQSPEASQQAAMAGDNSCCSANEFSPGPAFSGNPAGSVLPATGSRGQTYVSLKESVQGPDKKTNCECSRLQEKRATGFYSPGLYDSFRQAVSLMQQRSGVVKGGPPTLSVCQDAGRPVSACSFQNCSLGLAVAATVSAAATRLAEGASGKLRIGAQDLRFINRHQQPDSDICLLVDSSGSMADSRLQAAGYLAAEISRFGYNRLSLLSFQDNQAAVIEPFTASRQVVLNAFEKINPHGATPLALGIRYSLTFMKEQQVKNPLLILITDGIPSCRMDENRQPLADALAAAAEIRIASCSFLCIGLDSGDNFLQKLTTAAGGVMYCFPEPV
ncbi:vWA domain-containing protein [Sporomusa acidovorans]|uniref:VWFA domain-containing protein n=1 Tax=Sporomusa acidovorans (strain ATCC 49682 / DSM 3132 / Mol) TaxID=1123286 RepID=A0ABZ3IW94_SPOA4|nr:VWA domain-containing protein [Sporomusa acidovorans]OZC15280.1 von Willebrand factor type A domain protein [Sporomusa acidovorans DSM 3132]SDE91952.1 Mg-chelatase subunit ChlD [Sporomusa acidovorans]